MSAILDVPAYAEWWRLSEGALWAAGGEIEERRRADYVRQVEVVAELWNRTGRLKDDRSVMVADLMAWWKVTRSEAKDLLRHAELFRRGAIHEAAREGLLSKQHLTVIDKTLAEAPEPDRDEVEAIGRLSRTIPNPIRRALIIRDGGCAFPGCGRRPRQCAAHHVAHWADGGPTSVDNLVLVCGAHHRLIHHSHWTVTINEGRPEFSAGPDRGQRWQRTGWRES